ncbi:MAG: hypothetical protein ACT4QD_16465 [Acidobacteriota bacterium]
MSGHLRRCVFAVASLTAASLLVAGASPAEAQRTTRVVPPSVELGAGLVYAAQERATRDATFTSGTPGGATPLIFFKTDGKTRQGLVGAVSIGVNVTSAFGVEGGFQYSRPELSIQVSEDAEGVADVTIVAASFRQYVAEGNLVYHFNAGRFDARKTVPFVLVGAGLLRQRDEVSAEETGRQYQAGVGFKWFSRISSAGRAHGAGLRLDVRYVFKDGGLDFDDDGRRSLLVASAVATIGF